MVALSESNSVPSIPSRARPCVQGSNFVISQRPLLQRTSLESFASPSQVLQGKPTSSRQRLHRVDHSNQQYSVLALTDSSGAVVEHIAYQAYGQLTFTNAAGTTLSSSAKATRHSYTGREWDPSLELHHFRARWMSGVSGRFVGRDRKNANPKETNLFEFCVSMPLISLDAFGYQQQFASPSSQPNLRSDASPCGLLKVKCKTGDYFVPVYPNSNIPRILMHRIDVNQDFPLVPKTKTPFYSRNPPPPPKIIPGSGCATTPLGIFCPGGCQEIKTWNSNDNISEPILNHEGCHYCAVVDYRVPCSPCDLSRKGSIFPLVDYVCTWGAPLDGCVFNEVETTPLW